MLLVPRRLAALVLGGSLLLGAVATAAPRPATAPVAADRRATFGIGPASASGPDHRLYLNYVVTPAAVASDHVVVVNYSSTPLTLRVYATDALNDDKGGFSLLPAAKPAREAGTWVALGTKGGTGRITLRARSKAIVPLRVQVPADATPGDHAAGVVASLSTTTKDARGVNVQLDQRVATRVFFRVSGPVRPGLSVRVLRATYHDSWNPFGRGRTDITYRVRNTGNVKLSGDTRVSVRGWLGTRADAPRQPVIPLLLPGGEVTLSTTVHGVLPVVLEHADVSVSPRVVAGDADPGLRVYSGARRFWAVPWALLALALLLSLGLRRQLRRRFGPQQPPRGRHARGATAPQREPVAAGDPR